AESVAHGRSVTPAVRPPGPAGIGEAGGGGGVGGEKAIRRTGDRGGRALSSRAPRGIFWTGSGTVREDPSLRSGWQPFTAFPRIRPVRSALVRPLPPSPYRPFALSPSRPLYSPRWPSVMVASASGRLEESPSSTG